MVNTSVADRRRSVDTLKLLPMLAGIAALSAATPSHASDEAFLESARAALTGAQESGDFFVMQGVLDAFLAARPDLASELEAIYTELRPDADVSEPDAAAAEGEAPADDAPTEDAPTDDAPTGVPVTTIGGPAAPLSWREGWSGDADLGIEVRSGNTERSVVAVVVDATKTLGRWESDYRFAHNFSRAAGVRIEENYLGRIDARRELSERWALAGFINAERDLFSGFDYRVSVGLGPSYKVIDRAGWSWRVSAGPGVRFDKLETADGVDTVPVLGLESQYRQAILENLRFGNDITASLGDGQLFNIVTFLEADIYKRIAIRLAQRLDIRTDAPAGAETTDTTNTVSLVYNFGQQAE